MATSVLTAVVPSAPAHASGLGAGFSYSVEHIYAWNSSACVFAGADVQADGFVVDH